MNINLKSRDSRNRVYPFEVRLLDHGIEHLIRDANNAHRIYELSCIRRPGDIKKYLWVRVEQLPPCYEQRYAEARERAMDRYRSVPPWPEHQIPFTDFDDFFSWHGDDTQHEGECWLYYREGAELKAYLDDHFKKVQAAYKGLDTSGDPLIQHELEMIGHGHTCDYLVETPFERTSDSYQSIVDNRYHTEGYYAKLQELLMIQEIQSVACRSGADFASIKAFCLEQRRRVSATGKKPKEVFPICIMGDCRAFTKPWEAYIQWYYEGLGYGDLCIDMKDSGSNSMKMLVENHGRVARYILLNGDLGEIKGYSLETGDGWALYTGDAMIQKRTDEQNKRQIKIREMQKQLIESNKHLSQ